MTETVVLGDRFKCLRICNSTPIALSTSPLLTISSNIIPNSESDRRVIVDYADGQDLKEVCRPIHNILKLLSYVFKNRYKKVS